MRELIQSPGDGSSATINFDNSSRMRSALTIFRRSCIFSIASTSAASGSKPSVVTKRAARSMRSGSSSNEISGASGVRRRRAARSVEAVERIDELRSAPSASSSAIAIAFTVKSRRERSVSMSSENVTSGLRLSGRYTSARNVVISKRSPSFSQPTVPKR